jgi:hypothetical protein
MRAEFLLLLFAATVNVSGRSHVPSRSATPQP